MYGYDLGVISGALPSLSTYFQMTANQEEWVVALLYFGGGVGAATGGFICDLFGRKRAILITDLMFAVGALMLFAAQTVATIMIGRCVVGWAVAVSAIADVAYLHEISSVWEEHDETSANNSQGTTSNNQSSRQNGQNSITTSSSSSSVGGRGSVVSVNEACISLGFLLAYGVAFLLGESDSSDQWRYMFGFGGFIAVLQFFGMLCMPESPVWLKSQGRLIEATVSRNRIRGSTIHDVTTNASNSVEVEMRTTPPSSSHSSSNIFHTEDHISSQSTSSSSSSSATSYRMGLVIRLCSIPRSIKSHCKRLNREIFAPYKRQCIISFFLATSQQFCGHPSVLNFSAEIFSMLNGSAFVSGNGNNMGDEEQNINLSPVELTVGIGILKFLTTCIVILFVERVGRRPLLLSGMIIICLSLSFLIVAFVGVDISQQQQIENISSVKSNLGIIGIYGVAIGYAMSFGPLTWLITSELFPSLIRGRALGFATVFTYVAAGIVSRTFLSLENDIGLSKVFLLYCLATMVSIVFVWVGVPETGNERTSDEINRDLDNIWLWGGRRSHTWRDLRSYGSWGVYDGDGVGCPMPTTTVTTDAVIESEAASSQVGLSPRRSSSSSIRQVV